MILTFITNALAIFGGTMILCMLGIKIYDTYKKKKLEKAIAKKFEEMRCTEE